MTTKEEQEAAEIYASLCCPGQGPESTTWLTVASDFLAGIAWRDANPKPVAFAEEGRKTLRQIEDLAAEVIARMTPEQRIEYDVRQAQVAKELEDMLKCCIPTWEQMHRRVTI